MSPLIQGEKPSSLTAETSKLLIFKGFLSLSHGSTKDAFYVGKTGGALAAKGGQTH